MKYIETRLSGAFLIVPEPYRDERGTFRRVWCRREFEAIGVTADFVQSSHSYSRHKGTLRGLHYQIPPHSEAKLVSCIRGEIYDVIVDLRSDSATYREWVSVKLTSEEANQLYVPTGFAHGFQTLTDDVEVSYFVSAYHEPSAERGLRYDDPALGITWPLPVAKISTKDSAWPLSDTSPI